MARIKRIKFEIFKKDNQKVKLETAKLFQLTNKGEPVYHSCSCSSGCSKKMGRVLGKKGKFGFRYYCRNYDCHNLQNSQLGLCQDCREKYFGMKKREQNLGSGKSEYYQCDECNFEIRVGDHIKPYGWAERNVMKFGLKILGKADVSMRFTKDYEKRVEKSIKKHEEQTGHKFDWDEEEDED